MIFAICSAAATTMFAGFGRAEADSTRERVMKALEGFLRPEFINRVDEVIVFNGLTKESFGSICRIMLGDLSGMLADKGIELRYTDALVELLVEKGFSQKYGARNLRRLIQREIEDIIAADIIDARGSHVAAFALDAADGAVKVEMLPGV